ncbi:hypothetical protein [Streptomyces sp. AN091965]|uniref:hypothetical protein n=1 Tax=Streptomyces sp. AN091965 TaxID=2927803 RepID=UPI001F61F346|nr:hypothetical protein [Streptomyces sp. AN091965]MCI3930110.1 hypothetical protein [Streptomyces sp. AN091965]
MAGRRRGRGVWAAGIGLAVLAPLAFAGCGGPEPADTVPDGVRELLDRRAAAVLDRDERAYEATGGPVTAYDNVRELPLRSWSYRLKDFDRDGARATVTAELRYRVAGYDRAPLGVDRTLVLRERKGRWYVSSERPARKAAEQLWDQGRVESVRGTHSLVLGVGRERADLRRYARLADDAVPDVSAAWPRPWAGRVVVLVPRSLDGMADLLGAPASGYQGIAAVTTGEAGGSGTAPADRIIINPDAYGVLGDLGKQVVLTHEATHVATRADTSRATPLWLSEGFADWVGYRGTGRAPEQAAPELRRAVVDGSLPAALPEDADFGFSGDANRLSRAYEGSWLACRMIVEKWGERKLVEFYAAVGAHDERAGAVEKELRDVLGVSPEDFTARWRDYLRRELG